MAGHKLRWQERLFGRHLAKCDQIGGGDFQRRRTLDALEDAEIVGVYFSFANVFDDFVKRLRELYQRLNAEPKRRRLEVVQVVMWANNDVYNGDLENGHRDCLVGLPWFAVPYSEIDLKTRLSRRYRIKSGVPTLVLLDRDGNTVSLSAQDRLLEDPAGASFPWRPRPVDQVLKDVVLQPGGTYAEEHPPPDREITYGDLADGIRGFYFSANWCPPCRAFTPQLAEVYGTLRKREPGFEIIFVSSDRSPESYSASTEAMPWLAVPYQQTAVRAELAQLYAVRGIPTLLLLDANGHVITADARTELAEDPAAQNFPWRPRVVNVLTERFASTLHDRPAVVLFVDSEETELQFAEAVLGAASDALAADLLPDDRPLFLIGLDTEAGDCLRDLIGLDDLVPLLVGVDLPNGRWRVMEYGVEITAESVAEFAGGFARGEGRFRGLAGGSKGEEENL